MSDLNFLKKVKALGEAVAKTGKDLNQQTAGGDFSPPPAGPARARLVSYVELGVHTKRSKLYGDKTKPMARFTFELSGPKHAPREVGEGDEKKQVPYLISFEEPIGQGAKNNYSKLFKLMVKEYPDATNFIHLIGKGFRVEVFHRKYKVGDQERVAAELKSKESGYSIKPLSYISEETGELVKATAGPVLSKISAFVWDEGDDLDFWDSLHVDGLYDDGSTKNKIQEKIKRAENFVGSPVYQALIEAGREEETVPYVNPNKDAPGGDDDEGEEDTEQEGVQEAQEGVQETSEPEGEAEVAPPVEKPAKARKTAPAPAPAAAKAKPKAPKAPAKEPETGGDDDDPLAGL